MKKTGENEVSLLLWVAGLERASSLADWESSLVLYSVVTTSSKSFSPWKQVLSCGPWKHHYSFFWFWINSIKIHQRTFFIPFAFTQENNFKQVIHPFLSWQKDLNEKSNKALSVIMLPRTENLSFSNTHPQLLLIFKVIIWVEWFTPAIPVWSRLKRENYYDFVLVWGWPGYVLSSGSYLDTKWDLSLENDKIKLKNIYISSSPKVSRATLKGICVSYSSPIFQS